MMRYWPVRRGGKLKIVVFRNQADPVHCIPIQCGELPQLTKILASPRTIDADFDETVSDKSNTEEPALEFDKSSG